MKGSCLCGNVIYRIDGEIIGINYCHCKKCQKASGSAFATSAAIKAEGFNLISGNEYLAYFESSKNKKRYFCQNCGSPIYSQRKAESTIYLRLGTLDDDPIKRPEVHLYTKEKACWHEITDGATKLKEDEGLWF